jgi:hypothetical protein
MQEYPENYKINAAHGNDAGVLVMEATGISISAFLFVQAVCPEPFPLPYQIKWRGTGSVPHAFRETRGMPVLYGDYGRAQPSQPYIHLFTPQVPVVNSFQRDSQIADWAFPAPIQGIVVLCDVRYDDPLSKNLWNRVVNIFSPNTSSHNTTLDWARDTQLPFVIGALGYPAAEFDAPRFRKVHGIASKVSVLPGPPLADEKRANKPKRMYGEGSGVFSVFERQKLVLDREYAKRLLSSLTQNIQIRT